ncbi:MAG: bi-domain-containing oxidoreductase, partial [Candidatus Sericytochromatia bacterium]|nr:bi-domain-containing oxidoreductase [Candidatus Sericytochromatia bacterium]
TERMLVEFARASWWRKARLQPERVRQVLAKVRSDGLAATLGAVRAKLQQAVPLGYSQAGVVVALGEGVRDFAVGDRVVSNGPHAEYACVPVNLCARIPQAATPLADEEAAFTVLGAIALQGVRLAAPTLGETFAVFGLGVLGLLTVQLLRAHGCQVVALDLDAGRLALAAEWGAQVVNLAETPDPRPLVQAMVGPAGLDGALLTLASASDGPVHQAAQLCRKRGRLVLVGVTGLQLQRADFYEKELSFQVSCSYGPGRYDPAYEQRGQDYPLGFVRWTAKRNFEAVLALLAERRLDVRPLITQRVPFAEAQAAYAGLGRAGGLLGLVLDYGDAPAEPPTADQRLVTRPRPARPGALRVALVGAGDFATQRLLPALKAAGAELALVASPGGTRAAWAGLRFGAAGITSEVERVFSDPAVDAVVIASRHDSHARLVVQALQAGKPVFVEKPLAVDPAGLAAVTTAHEAAAAPLLAVGFNRRFAPLVQRLKRLLARLGGPRSLVLTVNAGALPAEHWSLDPHEGGGRLVAEGCHFVDLLRDLAGAPIRDWQVTAQGPDAQTFTLSLRFHDGSTGTLHYLASGHRSFPKERLEVFAGGAVLQLDNFRVLRAWGLAGVSTQRRWRQDKGHDACLAAFLAAVRTGEAPVPFAELHEVSRVTLEAAAAAAANAR